MGEAGQPLRTDPVTLRNVAVRIGNEAAALARTIRENTAFAANPLETKTSETDVVTVGDREVERLIRTRLAESRPGEPVLGEEGGAAGSAAATGVRWVVDPIDGTVNYLYGYPWYAVSIAAEMDGTSVAGAVVEPATGRVWSAARGHGSEVDGRPLAASAVRRLDLALLATGFSYTTARRRRQAAAVGTLLTEVRDIRRAGASSLDLCAVAAGWVDGYFEHGLHRWDWAAGSLIADEAGAVVRLPDTEADGGSDHDLIFVAAPGIAGALWDAIGRAWRLAWNTESHAE